MIQKFIFLFFLLFQFFTFAQDLPKKVKSDSVFQMNQNEFLIYQKKKSGVYNVSTNSYSKSLSKNYLHYIPDLKILVEFLPENYVQYYLDDYNKPKEKQLNKFSQFNAEYFTNENEIIKIDKNHFIVNSFTSIISPSVPLSDLYGEDSLDMNGNLVYYPSEPGKEKSGIFDISAKKWKIQPKYAKIHVLNNHYFCQKIYNDEGFFSDTSYFDLYTQNDKNEFIFIEKITNQTNPSDVYTKVTGIKAKRIHNTNYYVTNNDGKQGLIEFQLFWDDDFSNFYFKEYYSPNYQFVYYFENANLLLLKDENDFNFYKYNIEEEKLENIEIKFYNNKFTFQSDYSFYEQEFFFDIEKKDELLIIKDILGEYNHLIPFIDEYGEDSIGWDGNYVYPENEPGSYHSGIYDLKTKTWIVEPKYYYANTWNHKNFLVGNFPTDERGLIHPNAEIIFDVLNDKGEKIYADLKYFELISNVNIIQSLVEVENVNITVSDINYHSNKSLPNTLSFYSSKTYLIEKNGKYKIVDTRGVNIFDFNFFNQNYNDFVFTNEKSASFFKSFNFDFTLNQNSMMKRDVGAIYFYKMNELSNDVRLEPIVLLDNSFELNILYSHFSFVDNTTDAVMMKIVENDTSYYSIKIADKEVKIVSKDEFKLLLQQNNYSRSTNIKKSADEILINNSKDYLIYDSNNEYYDSYDQLYVNKYEWQQESSSVWRKIENQWVKISPSFYNIEKTKFGYICMTGYVKMIEELYDEGYYEIYQRSEEIMPSKYILFDNDFKPIKFLDFYDFENIIFYDFGYQIYLNTDYNNLKSVFINKNGRLISDTHFDEYYIENDKLVGESEELYDLDEYGDIIYDSDGTPVLYQKAERKIFENWEE